MFCPRCGNESNPYATCCSSCGVGRPSYAPARSRVRLVRPQQPRMLAGVCAGIAIYRKWDVDLFRMAFAVLTCLTLGGAVLVYLTAWALLPEALYAVPAPTRRIDVGNFEGGPFA